MTERPLGAIFSPDAKIRLRGIDPPSPQRVLQCDPAGGLICTIRTRADGSATLELQQPNAGAAERIEITAGDGPIVL